MQAYRQGPLHSEDLALLERSHEVPELALPEPLGREQESEGEVYLPLLAWGLLLEIPLWGAEG